MVEGTYLDTWIPTMTLIVMVGIQDQLELSTEVHEAFIYVMGDRFGNMQLSFRVSLTEQWFLKTILFPN